VIADLVIFLNSHDLWHDFSARVYLARGMVYHSLGALDAALDNYLVACNTTTPKGHLSAVSRASILLVRLAQGYDIRLSNDGKKSKGHAAAHLLPIIKTEGKEDSGLVEDYDSYVRTLLEDCHRGGPMLRLMGLLMDALTNAEIVRAKWACFHDAATFRLTTVFLQSMFEGGAPTIESDKQSACQAAHPGSTCFLFQSH
jgi:hypothetical protein